MVFCPGSLSSSAGYRFALEERVAKHAGVGRDLVKVTHATVEVVAIDHRSRNRALTDIRDHSRESLSRKRVDLLWTTPVDVDRARCDPGCGLTSGPNPRMRR